MGAYMRFFSLLFVLGLQAAPAFAGGMISSGGDLLRDAHNPWWVKNTKIVRYCIEIDQSSISGPREQVEALVNQAFEYWKAEFARRLKMVAGKDNFNQVFNHIGVGTQQFIKTACNGAEGLRIQFGYGTLTAAQRELIPDLRSHLGLTVRTKYDEAQLKGSGFIYLASDQGANSYRGGPEMIERPWQYEFFLYAAIVHELGHVFGIPHIGEPYVSLMSEQFLETMLNKSFAETLKEIKVSGYPPLPYLFFPSNYFVHCSSAGFSPNVMSYFSLPAGTRCLHFGIDGDNKQIYVSASATPTSYAMIVGRFAQLDLEAEASIACTLYLTERQNVFPLSTQPFNVISGPLFIRKKGSATYFPLSGAPRVMHIDLNPRSSFSFVGLNNNRLETILSAPIQTIPHF
jgi:hypothetical protein